MSRLQLSIQHVSRIFSCSIVHYSKQTNDKDDEDSVYVTQSYLDCRSELHSAEQLHQNLT